MRNLYYSLFLCLLFALNSCSEYGEEVWINADGSGRYEMSQDFSDVLPLIEMGMAGVQAKAKEDEENGTENEGLNMNNILSIFESGKVDTLISIEQLAKQAYEKDGKIYSKQAFKADFLKKMNEEGDFEGTPQEKEKIWSFVSEALKISTRIQYDNEYASLKNTMYQSFDNPKDMLFGNLPELIEIISKYSGDADNKLNDPKAKEAMEKMKDSFPSYEITKNTLKVRRKAMEIDNDDPESTQQMEMMKGMMGNSTYTMKIHVPGKVKKVSQDGAKFDGSTVTWTMSALDMYDTTKDLNLDIKFKPKKGMIYEN